MADFTTNASEVGSDALSDGNIWAKTLIYSNQPKIENLFLPDLTADQRPPKVINYSLLYKLLTVANPDASARQKFTDLMKHPSRIMTGDVLQNGGYRGVGSYYAVWLHEGVYLNANYHDIASINSSLPQKIQPSQVEEDEVDPFAFGLSTQELIKLQNVLTDYECDIEGELNSLLAEKAPGLLQFFLEGDDKFMSAFSSLRFSEASCSLYVENEGDDDDDGEEGEEEEEEDEANIGATNDCLAEYHKRAQTELKRVKRYVRIREGKIEATQTPLIATDVFDQNNYTKHVSEYFQTLPLVTYPILKPRKLLQTTVAKQPWMQCYLFCHSDEMGYTAPTAVSMARLGYFSGEYKDRDIDLTLLPPPLDKQTICGHVLHDLHRHLPETVKERDIAAFNLEGANAIMWFTAESAAEYFSAYSDSNDNFTITREMFRKHAELVREKIINKLEERDLSTASADETVIDDVIQQLFE